VRIWCVLVTGRTAPGTVRDRAAADGITPAEWMRRAILEAKNLYEAMHPETKHVSERGGPGRGNKTDESDSSVLAFTTTAATDGGITERAVQTSIQIAKNLSPEVKDAIRGSELADRHPDTPRNRRPHGPNIRT
jgi:hypothetical protein